MIKYWSEYFNRQEGRSYPCSNQIVVCAVVTKDKDKALSVMNEKGAIIKMQSPNSIEWELNNERWLWRDWNVNNRGYRFYKTLVDENLSEEQLLYVVAQSSIYCCSMEII